MGELGFNKFFGAALATILVIFGLNEVSTGVFGGGGHHGGHHYDTQNEWAADKFHGYRIDIAETSAGGGGDAEEVFDLGFLLASADPAAGETVMRRQCATCHTADEGGANGTGPNLHGIVGRPVAAAGTGFAYSGALSGIGGNWTYEQLNDWLTNPGSFARGTSMAYAGLRSPRRDADRVNLIAYLASVTPAAPDFPAPLATEASLDAVDTTEIAAEIADGPNETAADVAIGSEAVAEAATDAAAGDASIVETVAEAAETATADATETVESAATGLLDQVVETAEEAADTALETATDAAEAVTADDDGGQ